ncbi:MAG: hypothetical protein M0R80_03260 [Proteobacteria bacterium]|jgi:predicted nucleic acid-binding protein|nr:hypothetical protein [Pseudomonadota bacterium]
MAIDIKEKPMVIRPVNSPELILDHIKANIKELQKRATILERRITNGGNVIIQKVA